MTTTRRSKPVPTYVVIVAVLAAAGVTGFAMMRVGVAPPWVTNKPFVLAATPQAWIPWTAAGAPTSPTNILPVGGMTPPNLSPNLNPNRPASISRADIIPAHGDRGVCTGCHTMTDTRGMPIPSIRTSATLFHEFRGVCVNCHTIIATPAAASPPIQPLPAMPNIRRTAAPAPTEGEWLGVEVSPISQLTATQFSIPPGTQGLVIVEAEAAAATAGLKPGDVVVAVNGVPIRTMTDFFQATRNGTMTAGALEVLRAGQRLAVNLTQAVVPGQVPAASPGQVPAAVPGQPFQGTGVVPPLQVNPIATIQPRAGTRAPTSF